MEGELTVRNTEVGMILPPEQVLENAKTAAKALVSVISQKKKPVVMNGEQYLEFEDWQTVAQFYGYAVRTGDAQMVEIDGVKGAKAHADLIDVKTGLMLGGAEAYCMRDEEKWNTRPKYEWQGEGKDARRVKIGDEPVPFYQLASMAQTRAGAKALRNRLAWVVVLAGYRPTPAEEITETTSEAVKERRTVDKSQHYCPVHDVNYFKKGRMKGYSHPVDGTDPQQWCNEPEERQDNAPNATDVAQGEYGGSSATEDGELVANRRLLLDTIKTRLKYKTDSTAASWLENIAKVSAERAYNEPAAVLKELQERLGW